MLAFLGKVQGQAKAGIIAITGYNPLLFEKVSNLERGLHGATILVPFVVKGGKLLLYGKHADEAAKVLKGEAALNHLDDLDSVKNVGMME